MARDDDLAWSLADHIVGQLSPAEMSAIYVELGCGNCWEAITQMIKAILREGVFLPPTLMNEITGWLDGYVGHVDEPTTRKLLHELERRSIRARDRNDMAHHEQYSLRIHAPNSD